MSDGEREFRKRSGKSPAGQNRQLTLQRPSGAWLQNSDGRWTWTASIRSAGAAGIRVHFTRFDVGRGVVWVHNGSGETEEVLGPYTGKGLFNDGDFWICARS